MTDIKRTEHRLSPSELDVFWLGKVVKRHDVAGVEVIQYHPRLTMGGGHGGALSSRYSTKRTMYGVDEYNRSFESLGEAVTFIGLMMSDNAHAQTAEAVARMAFHGIGG